MLSLRVWFVLLLNYLACSNVIDLTPQNFDSIINGKIPALVEFFAPWCGHCKNLAPIYEELADSYESSKKNIIIAKVDADQHKELGSRFGIKGFPTLKWFAKGSTNPEDYSGGRSLDDLSTFIKTKTGKSKPTFVKQLTDSTFDSIVMDENLDVFVEFYSPSCGHCQALAPAWSELGSTFFADSKVVIAKIDAAAERAVADRFKIQGFPTLLFFGKNDKSGKEKYESARDINSLVSYVNKMTGSTRVPGGALTEDAGRSSALDEKAQEFITSSEGERESILAAAKKIADDSIDKIYISYMKKILEKGDDFVDNELARIGRLLENGGFDEKKRDSFYYRRNILAAFK